jgi:S-adenosylmethionine synthetase
MKSSVIYQRYERPPFEVVERKGVGHPDTLADGISESISRELCRYYLDEFGQILHHNVDKVLIVAGRTDPKFGGGEVLEPPTVIVGGRATAPSGEHLEVIVKEATADHLKRTVKNLREYRVEVRAKEGSPELKYLIGRGANDTSIGVGFAPLDTLERLVLAAEERIRGIKGVGEDTKVMAVRMGDELQIVAAAAMISRYITSIEVYEETKREVREAIRELAEASVAINAADTSKNIFLTITGTSAEMGDDGATGRGNRGNGLITPMRPMSIEAIAGKNPVNHVGKIYNVIAERASADIAELDGVTEAYVTLVSKIGSPLSEPLLKGVRIACDMGSICPDESKISSIIDYWLVETENLLEEFVAGRLRVC